MNEARAKGLTLRLLGGIAIALTCREVIARNAALDRDYNDIDLTGYSNQRQEIERFLISKGFQPAREFNFLFGGRRLMFFRNADRVKVDIFLDRFQMCHSIDLRFGLERNETIIGKGNLLLTKLQVVELAERDVQDLLALLISVNDSIIHHQEDNLETELRETISRACGNDWGLWKTSSLTVAKLSTSTLLTNLVKSDSDSAVHCLDLIKSFLDQATKSFLWKLRNVLGERIKWYELPEEPLHFNFPDQDRS